MAIKRLDNTLIVVKDLEASISLFEEIGMELEAQTQVSGDWVGNVIGLDDVRSDIAVLKTPDGHGRVELSSFVSPEPIEPEPSPPPANTLGVGRVMFAVDDVDDTVERLKGHGVELVGNIVQFEDAYRLCYVRTAEGYMIGLAQQLS